MRIFTTPLSAVQEVERDLWEMGLNVHPQTFQDRNIADDPDYLTKEVRHYGFHLQGWKHNELEERGVLDYVYGDELAGESAQLYIAQEFGDRVSGIPSNPGGAFKYRTDVWNEFLHDGKFSYTYSERMAPQILKIVDELRQRPETRQAIINIHSNIAPSNELATGFPASGGMLQVHKVGISADLKNMGGKARIPCSLHYQLMIREGKVDLSYCMRSCDFLTHFPVDIMLALRLQSQVAAWLDKGVGMFTYYTGSLHSYAKDMKVRGIF